MLTLNRLISMSAIERRSWPMFGEALKGDTGSKLTMVPSYHTGDAATDQRLRRIRLGS
jgi:hypothetical protein